MCMERLSADLSLALEESAGRLTRRKLGPRRRTRSAGNLPSCVAAPVIEEAWSSSPRGAVGEVGDDPGGSGGNGAVLEPLSDSDDPPPRRAAARYCHIANIESDSFNENFSPARPANARRKRKLKKMTVEYFEDKDIDIITSIDSGLSGSTADRHKPIKQERNIFCGKRKWSHIDKDTGEMRERSFSGGCTSKPAFIAKSEFKKKHDERRRKEVVLQPGKIVLKSHNVEDSRPFTSGVPGSSSFNFVYRNMSRNGAGRVGKTQGFKVVTELPPSFSEAVSSSSLSSSEEARSSEGEGDDELTDWPGIEELKVFSRSLSFRRAPPSPSPLPSPSPHLPPPSQCPPSPLPSLPPAKRQRVLVHPATTQRNNKRHNVHDGDVLSSVSPESTGTKASEHKRRCIPFSGEAGDNCTEKESALNVDTSN